MDDDLFGLLLFASDSVLFVDDADEEEEDMAEEEAIELLLDSS